MSAFEIILCLCLISFSAFLSSSEIALFSLSRFQLRSLKDGFRTSYRNIKRLIGDPGGLLISILVLNEIINISISAIVAQALDRGWDDLTSHSGFLRFLKQDLLPFIPDWAFQTVVGTLITAPIVLLFCEITPKVTGARANQLIATLSSGPMAVIYDLLKPIRFLLESFLALVKQISHSSRFDTGSSPGDSAKESGESHSHSHSALLKEEEFLTLVEEGHREGAVQETELELIRNVFNLDNSTVEEIYTPLETVLTLPQTMSLKAASLEMQNRRFSRIPITGASKKKVVGVLYTKDLLLLKLETDPELLSQTIAAVMRKPMAVGTHTPLNALFLRMKKQKMHMAIVENNQGDAIGVVTMNDVLQALFEDIIPEGLEGAKT